MVDLSSVADLRVLASDDGHGLRVGAAVTARQVELDPRARGSYQALAESGALVGSVQVRNFATVGGNLCNAAPSAVSRLTMEDDASPCQGGGVPPPRAPRPITAVLSPTPPLSFLRSAE